MGTSVRKTTAKIKKLLKDTVDTNPNVEPDEIIPDVANQTIKSKKAKAYFGDKDFAVLTGGGMSCFSRIASGGYERFYHDFDVDKENLTAIDIQKIIEAILDEIEKENGDIQSSFILNAFKTAMTKALLESITNPIDFLTIFCEIFLTMIIREAACEEILSQFKSAEPVSVDESIASFAKNYVHTNLSSCIKDCVTKGADIQTLIQSLQNCLR